MIGRPDNQQSVLMLLEENQALQNEIEKLRGPEYLNPSFMEELISLRSQVNNVRQVLRKMGFVADSPKVENDVIVFAFEAQFWEQDSLELKALKPAMEGIS